jgi:SAM-dependent methyltransferase
MQRYLEIGCGTGYVLAGLAHAYPKASLTGSDVFTAGLYYAARRVQDADFIQMDARHIPYTEEFDVIGAFDVLEHIKEDEAVLSEMLRALRPGGDILITVPQHPWLWSVKDDYARHVRRYRSGELRGKIRNAGLLAEYETSFVSLLLPLMAASRLAQPRKSNSPVGDPLAEMRLSAVLNRIFEGVMDIELMLIRLGIHFPFGGSILLMARKAGTHV